MSTSCRRGQSMWIDAAVQWLKMPRVPAGQHRRVLQAARTREQAEVIDAFVPAQERSALDKGGAPPPCQAGRAHLLPRDHAVLATSETGDLGVRRHRDPSEAP